jgi:hypothetical protein
VGDCNEEEVELVVVHAGGKKEEEGPADPSFAPAPNTVSENTEV